MSMRIGLSAFVLGLSTSASAVSVTHAGYLLDSGDRPVQGTVPMSFRVWNGETAGQELWSSGTCAVLVQQGRWHVSLGDACGPSIGAGVFAGGQSRWIEATVQGIVLAPRLALAPVPVAQTALTSVDAQQLRAELGAAGGTLNDASNPVDWSRIKGVPADVAAGGNYVAGAGLVLLGRAFSIPAGAVTDAMLSTGLSGAKLAAGSIPTDRLTAIPLAVTTGNLDATRISGVDVPALQTSVSSLQSGLSGTQGNVSTLQTQVSAQASELTALTTRVAALESGGGAASSMRVLASAPSGCGSGTGGGLMYFDSVLKVARVCDGTRWTSITASSLRSRLPGSPVQAVDFSQAATPGTPSTWDEGTATASASVSSAAYDATEKALKTTGSSSSYFDTGWKPSGGGKTACMWKKWYDATAMAGDYGLEGYQAPGQYFYYGSYNGKYYSYSASSGGTSTTGPSANQWIFYCLASSGSGGTSNVYVAAPGAAGPSSVLTITNGSDGGHLSDSVGMIYGKLNTNQHPSSAYYGGFIHYDIGLTASQVQQVYDATKVYYPGHGGTR